MNKKTSLGILVALLAIYIFGVFIFSFYTYPKTYINNTELGFVNKSEIYNKDLRDFKLTIKGKDGKTAIIPAQSVSYEVKLPKDFKLEQNSFTWPIELFRKQEITIDYDIDYNKERLIQLLESSELYQNTKEPQNAYVDFDGKEYIIYPEEEGNAIDTEKLMPKIANAFNEQIDTIEVNEEYRQPEITADNKELMELRDNLNEIAKIAITLDLDYKEYELKGQNLRNLFEKEGTALKLNEDLVREYVRNIAIETDTFGKTREFQTTGRGLVTVEGGIYGWQMDVDKTKEEIIDKIKNKESVTIEPIYIHRGLYRSENDDIGNTYLEIDLTRQHMWYYKNGELLVETDIVTGDPTKNHPTPTGVDKIWSREEGRTLRGQNFGGNSEYAVDVNYWMPINWDGIGIHDTDYRDQYGGKIYQGNGSHGCINTPYEKVKEIFNNIVNNTPVIVYES